MQPGSFTDEGSQIATNGRFQASPFWRATNVRVGCSFILYEAVGADGKDVILTGVDINDSDYRVAVARLEDGTDKAEWTAFNVPFEYLEGKAYDKEKTYKLAIICSSSKEGDKFKGAVGSTLIVDELEVLGE